MHPSPAKTSESFLLRLRNPSDAAAWQEFVDVFGPMIYRVARSRGLQPTDAEDVVQTVHLAVTQQLEGWLARKERGRFRAWLQTIARNLAIKEITRRQAISINVINSSVHPDRSEEISEIMDIEYRRELVRWACVEVQSEFSATTWQAFELTYLQGFPISQVADQLKLSKGAVYIARSRVLARLGQLVKKERES